MRRDAISRFDIDQGADTSTARSPDAAFRFDGRELRRDTKVIRSPRRFWLPMANTWLRGASSITARAGILGAGSEDPAALGSDWLGTRPRTEPNVRATEQEIYDGSRRLQSQNCWPSLKFDDLGALNDLLSPLFLPAGFYYKTFMGPPGSWMLFEPFIRKAGGLGRAPSAPDPDDYETLNRHCEVLVIGGGPTGLMAALSAARSGARVILVEETARLGGELLSIDPKTTTLDGEAPADWVRGVEAALRGHDDVLVLTRTCGFGYYGDNFVALWERVSDHLAPEDRAPDLPRQRLWRIRAKQVVLATGAIERPLVFHENDRPGIMLAGATRTYLHRYGVLPGRRALLFANNDRAWAAAFDLQRAGAEIAGIVDVRPEVDAELLGRAAEHGMPVHLGTAVTKTSGRRRVTSVRIRSHDGEGGLVGPEHRIACDLIASSGGLTPNIALFSQSRGKLRYDASLAAFRPGRSWQQERSRRRLQRRLGRARLSRGGRARRGRRCLGCRLRYNTGRATRASDAQPAERGHRGHVASPGQGREGLRRSPGRCHGTRSAPRGSGRLPLGRARQALHHGRHGHGPGQDVEHERLRHPLGRA